MQTTAADPNRFAQDLFRPLPRRYDLLEELLSLGQNGRWRREMVAHVDGRRIRGPSSTSPPGQPASRSRSPGGPSSRSPASTSPKRCSDAGTSASQQAGRCGSRAARRRSSRTASLSRRLIRRADVHLSAALRRRSRRDACASSHACSGRARPIASLEFSVPAESVLAVLVVDVHARRAAGCGLLTGGREWSRVGRFLGPNISTALPPLPGGLDHPSVERRRTRRTSAFAR